MAKTARTIGRRDLLKAPRRRRPRSRSCRGTCWAAPGRPAPSEKLNIAGVGVGGMGAQQSGRLRRPRTSWPCATSIRGYAAKTFAQVSARPSVYKDFRVMLDQQKDIDAVIVATPDHTHAVVALAAIQRGQARLRAEADDPLASTRPAC